MRNCRREPSDMERDPHRVISLIEYLTHRLVISIFFFKIMLHKSQITILKLQINLNF
jgi:hypothetical protein